MRNIFSSITLTTIFSFIVSLALAQDSEVEIATPNGKTDFCVNQPITLVAQTTNVATDDIVSLTWDGDMTIVEKDLGDILILRPQKKGNYTFTVSLNDKFGNKISETVTVKVKPITKATLRVKNNSIIIDVEENSSSCTFSYFINNQQVNEDEFKKAEQAGKYFVITTADGCSAMSNTIEIP